MAISPRSIRCSAAKSPARLDLASDEARSVATGAGLYLLTDASEIVRFEHTSPTVVMSIAFVATLLLNVPIGFGNLLHVQVTFSMPRLHLESLGNILKSVTIGKEELRYAVVVSTAFRVKDSEVSGYLILVLGVSSLERLVHGIEDWEGRQGA